MENQNKNERGLFLTGLALCFISYCILLFTFRKEIRNTDIFDEGSIFFINYGLAILYLIIIYIYNLSTEGRRFYKFEFRLFVPFLILFTISGFSLNMSMSMFSEFATWLKWYVGLMHVALFGLCFIDKENSPLKPFLFFITGLSFMIALYFTILMLPLMPYSIPGAIFFGLTLHSFIPLMWLVAFLVQVWKKKNSSLHLAAFLTGSIAPLLVVAVYLYKFNQTEKLIHQANSSIITRPDNTLPEWVLLSQVLPQDYFTDKIINGSLSYDTWEFFGFGFRGRGNSFGEMKKHDPLALIGLMNGNELSISTDDRIKILQSQFDARHASQRKLWSGENLVTNDVLTNIQVFPDYRLAYIEKIISITNVTNRRWRPQEEAAYTFHLPEGSVATSLSLWINGIEEKSRLTTKGKADSAYVSIVGVERRDPALLHWQEGNTITVTVFPCTPEEPRKFKIGVTIPLESKDDKMVLKNVYFEGPEIKDALETTVIEFVTTNSFKTPGLPGDYELVGDKKYQYTGKYKPYWEIELDETPLSQNAFTFNGKSFTLQPLSAEQEFFDPSSIYLDINKSWSENDLNEVWHAVKGKEVFVYFDKPIKLTDDNKEQMFGLLNKQNFSLFPLHKIAEPSTTLIISKSPEISPNLADLKESTFYRELKTSLATNTPPRLFSLSKELSPYLKTLKEYRVFTVEFGDAGKLAKNLSEKKFIRREQDNSIVELDMAEVQIVSDSTADSSSTASAPDHLMRLFAYNHILKKIGNNYFSDKGFVEDDLIGIANEAYVVSPISSLVVLETIKDYERFGIEENENSLKNASTQSTGSVPEPHEWVLIVLTFLMLTWMYFKNMKRVKA